MKKNKEATSIVEALVIMLIVIIGVVGMYSIFARSRAVSIST
jgi:Tfp pilus assembly protein PilV